MIAISLGVEYILLYNEFESILTGSRCSFFAAKKKKGTMVPFKAGEMPL